MTAELALAVVLVLAAARFFEVLAYTDVGLEPCRYLDSFGASVVYNAAVGCYFAAG